MERRQWLLGLLATAAALAVWWAGYLYFLELITQDWRQYLFYSRTADPSDRISLVAIDDQSLDTVGRWPWDRERMARIIDELRRAEASVVAMDVLFNEPQKRRYVEAPNPLTWEWRPEETLTDAQRQPSLQPVNDDSLLQAAIYAHGSVVLATKLAFAGSSESSGARGTTSESEVGRFELSLDAVLEAVEADDVRPALDALNALPPALRDAPDPVDARIYDDAERAVLDGLRKRLLTDRQAAFTSGQEIDVLRLRLDRVRALQAAGDTSSIPLAFPERNWPRSTDPNPPIFRLVSAAARLANVSFNSSDPGGVTRRIPLWVRHRDRLWPSLGLAAVMEYRGIPSATIEGNQTVLAPADGEAIRIDLMRSRLEKTTEIDGLTYITWARGGFRKPEQVRTAVQFAAEKFKTLQEQRALIFNRPPSDMTGWEWQLFDLQDARTRIVSAGRLYEPALQMERVRTNILAVSRAVEACFAPNRMIAGENLDRFRLALRRLLGVIPGDDDRPIPFDADDTAWLGALTEFRAQAAAAAAEALGFIESNGLDRAKLDEQVKDLSKGDSDMILKLDSGITAVEQAVGEIDRSIRHIALIRGELMNILRRQIVVVGFTASGTDADVVITPVDSKTPGPMVHVAVINSLLRETDRTSCPEWLNVVVIIVMGLTGTWLGVRFNVVSGPITLAAIILVWFLLAGYILWDLRLLIAAVAGPSVAAAGGWVTVLLHRLLVEQRGRKVTEERFKSYVSPAVVDILVNNPELGTMKPSMREMTVMFTDVADFTTTSERLGPELLAKCLSKYLKEMTEILQKNRGTLDKYLGDGIMCFYNAPIDDAEHARNACLTAVQMIRRLDELNDAGAFEEAGRLKVRVGLCTGPCMVGDFGNPPRNSNYTLLGDTANFAARLEGANKFFGTRILGTQRVRDQAGPDVRWRHIGRVFVKGKKEADSLYELIGSLEPHGPATDDWIDLTNAAVEEFAARDFDGCLKKFDVLAKRFGDLRLAELYAETIAAWRARPDFPDAFDGAIVLTEK